MPALFAMYASRQEVTKVRGEAGPGNLGQEKMIQIMTSKGELERNAWGWNIDEEGISTSRQICAGCYENGDLAKL